MLIAQSRIPHVSKFDVTLRAAVHKQVAVYGVEFGSGDDLGQLLHVHGLDVHDVFPSDEHSGANDLMQMRRLLTEATVTDV